MFQKNLVKLPKFYTNQSWSESANKIFEICIAEIILLPQAQILPIKLFYMFF